MKQHTGEDSDYIYDDNDDDDDDDDNDDSDNNDSGKDFDDLPLLNDSDSDDYNDNSFKEDGEYIPGTRKITKGRWSHNKALCSKG